MSTLSFAPQARPVDTFFKVPTQEAKGLRPEPNTRLAELAEALKAFQKPTERILDKTYEAHSRHSYGEGKRLAALHKDWDKAIQDGEKHVTESPFFQKGFLEGQGRLQGMAYAEALTQAYEAWEGKNHVDSKTLGTPEESKPFLEFIAKVRAPFLGSATQGSQTHVSQTPGSQTPDWLNGFQPMMEMAEANLLNHHLAYKKAFLEEARFKQFEQEAFSIVKGKGTPQDIVQHLEVQKQQATFEGLNPHKVSDRVRTATLAALVELGTHGVGGPHGGDVWRAQAILRELPQTSAEDKVKITHTHEVLNDHVYTQEGKAHHRIEQARKEASQKANQYIMFHLLEDINWQPSAEETKGMIALGVSDYPQKVEALRGELNKVPKKVNVQESLKFTQRLHRGLLTDKDILTSDHLSREDKNAAFKTNANQKDFINDPRVTAVRHKVKERFAPTDAEKMTPGSGALQYDAEAVFLRELYELQRQNPGIANDPMTFHKVLNATAERVIKAFKARKEKQQAAETAERKKKKEEKKKEAETQ